jgi:hypothetical protein
MDIVGKITSYARAVPAGLKAAGQELAKTASAMTGTDTDAPAAPRRRKKTTTRRARTTKGAKGTPATAKRPKAKRATAKKKTRKAKR